MEFSRVVGIAALSLLFLSPMASGKSGADHPASAEPKSAAASLSRQQSPSSDASTSDATDGANDSFQPTYSKGFFLGLDMMAYYRDMQNTSGWRYIYGSNTRYKNARFSTAAALSAGYYFADHWGVRLQGGATTPQKVRATVSGTGYSVGDQEKLSTRWISLMLRARLEMDTGYYYYADFGPAYVRNRLRVATQPAAAVTTSHSVWRPSVAFGVVYQFTEQWGLGMQYQLIAGQGNWRDASVSGALRVPALQTMGIVLSYQFGSSSDKE